MLAMCGLTDQQQEESREEKGDFRGGGSMELVGSGYEPVGSLSKDLRLEQQCREVCDWIARRIHVREC